ncbi:MAG: TraI domain-containing protein [Gammaproteobacteria bacterium]|nr:TraI domain-containing protein [Gammaproteobacteria bacterium]
MTNLNNTSENEPTSIPSYPATSNGLPVQELDEIIHTHMPLITDIDNLLQSQSGDFHRFIRPVLNAYADLVHLLPASETHHHHYLGGLFKHGLEVCYLAASKTEQESSNEKFQENLPKWVFSTFLAGLMHDIGKPLSDYSVTNDDGSIQWDPYSSCLLTWAKKESLSNYHIHWYKNRNNRHKLFSVLNVNNIITPQLNAYLNQSGSCYKAAIMGSILGVNPSSPISKNVRWADKESVRIDLKKRIQSECNVSGRITLEETVFDAIRNLAKHSQINRPGSIIWRSESSVYIVWNKAIEEVYNTLGYGRLSSIPNNHDILADILIERGFAIPPSSDNPFNHVRYWNIYPENLRGQYLICLRIDKIELVFPGEPPSPLAIFLEDFTSHQAIESVSATPSLSVSDNKKVQEHANISQNEFKQHQFQEIFINQVLMGSGYYIDGKVETLSDNEHLIYRLNQKSTIKRICDYHNWNSSRVAAIFLNGIEGLEIDDKYISIRIHTGLSS